ncbi:4-hydroxy-3-methylbut-2-enyl diphosphate reductase [Micromonospora sp. HM134]|uniref:4-hydroxy-3-methylbut-2-enyl diphosphate reductase n=1 Tax=Micromonospora sp. HM134 TaxID=2583243 RepID=UPI0011989EF0|nr:4-hydroxy-3-methylbut-2-enyl diphosphate reductase [Micromonospora sp. HM134]QDY11114.1 4-hydroxy-3-methylbut-2-enyl diphosphate reductase [Micromonospora sp. HM134]
MSKAEETPGSGHRHGGGRVVLAEPRSFCAGVRRAIGIVDEALRRYPPPVYVRKQIVHNHYVVRDFERRGVVFVDSEAEVPEGAVCVFSAHGVSPMVRERAADRQLDVIDATCPLVAKVHQQIRRYARDERTVLLIGHADHEEVEGTYGEAPDRTVVVADVADVARLELPRDEPVAYLTQTTLSLDETAEVIAALEERFDDLHGPGSDDICYASQNRQNAVRQIAAVTDVVLVVGSPNSSNSVRMVEVAARSGTPARLLPDVTHLDRTWLAGARSVGLSSGASVPELLVEQVVERLAEYGFDQIEVVRTATENITFSLPGSLATPHPDTGAARVGPERPGPAGGEDDAP